MQLRREEQVEERKDKPEERVEDLEVRDDEARDIAGGKKKAGRRVAGKKGQGHAAAKRVHTES
jgi:hypothetical protein